MMDAFFEAGFSLGEKVAAVSKSPTTNASAWLHRERATASSRPNSSACRANLSVFGEFSGAIGHPSNDLAPCVAPDSDAMGTPEAVCWLPEKG
jgi:hypothetical protein